ncbi:MAG: hypothetical protein K0S71_2880 [Clostridia bacterium]|nr:hypothetical protein [Clostridia bacterium]
MWKVIWKAAIVILLFLGITLPCLAQEYTVAALIEESKKWDGQAITLEGEVIGDIMFRKNMAWFNISDETGAIGVWIDTSEAKKINLTGNYRHHGDNVKISGIFHRALKEQGGEMAIAGESIEIYTSGKEIIHPIQTIRLAILGIMTILTFIIYLIKLKIFNH